MERELRIRLKKIRTLLRRSTDEMEKSKLRKELKELKKLYKEKTAA